MERPLLAVAPSRSGRAASTALLNGEEVPGCRCAPSGLQLFQIKLLRQFGMQRRRYGPRCIPSGQARPGTTTTGATGATMAPGTTTTSPALARQPPYGPRWNPIPHPPATRVTSDVRCESRGATGSAWALKDIKDPTTAHAKVKLNVLDIGSLFPHKCSSNRTRQELICSSERGISLVHAMRGTMRLIRLTVMECSEIRE
jgi:hypothetical protein